MEIRGIAVVVALLICLIQSIETSEFSSHRLTTDHTCKVPDVIPLPGPVLSVLECAVGCLNESNLCYNNGTSTCTCCTETSPAGLSATQCYRRKETCPDGWAVAGWLCLFVHSEIVDFAECKNVCDDCGSKILTPENPEQTSDMLTFFEGEPDEVVNGIWLGVFAYTTEPDRLWYYSDTGNVVTYFNWGTYMDVNEPNGHLFSNEEKCVMGKLDARWHDVTCDRKCSCICQK